MVRIGEPCRLCFPGASGPGDCGLAYLVRSDEDLRALYARLLAQTVPAECPHCGAA
jgi:hypothetical protein